MNQASQVKDIPHEANLRLAQSARQFNRALLGYKNGWLRFVVPVLTPVALSALGFAAWQNLAISLLFFCFGASAVLLLSVLRPYPHSPEYIYDNATWAAFYASFYHYDTLRMDVLDENGAAWSKWILQFYDKDKIPANTRSEMVIDVLCISILAEIIRASDGDPTQDKPQ